MSYSIFQTAIWCFLTYKNCILFIISYKKLTRIGRHDCRWMTAKFRPFLVAYILCVEMNISAVTGGFGCCHPNGYSNQVLFCDIQEVRTEELL